MTWKEEAGRDARPIIASFAANCECPFPRAIAVTLIAFIPAVVLLFLLFRWPLSRVFLSAFLPLYLMLPGYFFWKVPLLPPITVTDATLLPMGLAVLVVHWRDWRFTRTDVPLLLFLISFGVADLTHGRTTVGMTAHPDREELMDIPYFARGMLWH